MLDMIVDGTVQSPGNGYALTSSFSATANGIGSSFVTGTSPLMLAGVCATGAGATATADDGANIPTTVMPTNTGMFLYVDESTGELKFRVTGVPLCSVIFWLDATASYENV